METTKRHDDLYAAALKGDWNKAEEIFKEHTGDVRAELLGVQDTVLHAAVIAGKKDFVRELVNKYLVEDDLEKKNKDQNTAFHVAALSGDTELAELMLKKHNNLPTIRNGDKMLPVLLAALLGHEKMVRYLYAQNKDNLEEEDRSQLLVILIRNELYDVAHQMVKDFPELAVSREKKTQKTALHVLAQKPLMVDDFERSKQGIWERYYYQLSGTKKIENKRMHPKALKLVKLLWKEVVDKLDYCKISELIRNPHRLLFDAAKEGNIEFLSIITCTHPGLIFEVNEENYSIFHTAVSYRHENIFRLIRQRPSIKNAIVSSVVREKNNILHLAAELPPDQNRLKIVPGAALQMQREMWWFKEVKELMPPIYAEAENGHKKTARTLFTESHKKLMKEGEEWMKTTAESCTLVATLIATVVFAAAFTVPGGLNSDKGTPLFIRKAAFIIFAVSDTISLVSSACSILTFLSILTARYAEEDFLRFLPGMLLLGFCTLSVSITGMMVVYCTTLFIVFAEGTIAPAVLVIALAPIPVMLFIYQQRRLISDIWGLISKSLLGKLVLG